MQGPGGLGRLPGRDNLHEGVVVPVHGPTGQPRTPAAAPPSKATSRRARCSTTHLITQTPAQRTTAATGPPPQTLRMTTMPPARPLGTGGAAIMVRGRGLRAMRSLLRPPLTQRRPATCHRVHPLPAPLQAGVPLLRRGVLVPPLSQRSQGRWGAGAPPAAHQRCAHGARRALSTARSLAAPSPAGAAAPHASCQLPALLPAGPQQAAPAGPETGAGGGLCAVRHAAARGAGLPAVRRGVWALRLQQVQFLW